MALFFGGVWYPATTVLTAIFGNESYPAGLPMSGDEWKLLHFTACIFFWTWTNIAGLCLMSSILGEICRGWLADDEGKHTPNLRIACTRGFFVYLVVLLNDIAVVGNLSSSITDTQGIYIRMAVISSVFCFIASYRPQFFEGLIGRFANPESTEKGL